jgi:hypothetical protein
MMGNQDMSKLEKLGIDSNSSLEGALANLGFSSFFISG